MGTEKKKPPAIIWGAAVLAVLSLVWSAYAITDLMNSGPFGLSVALAGDIGWITVLWAEYKGISITGKGWVAPATGWAIAAGVGVLLVLHGRDTGDISQAIAGPFVVLIGKAVWTFALAGIRDPAALTAEQEAEIHAVMRGTEFDNRLHAAELVGLERQADAEIARIRAEARTTLARDDADFTVGLERLRKRAEIERRTPLGMHAAAKGDTPVSLPVSPVSRPLPPGAKPQATRGDTPVSPTVSLPVSRQEPDAAEEGQGDGASLAEIAAVAGVPTPLCGETLSDEQLLVVLRWLRHADSPPLSYRTALRLFRAEGFSGKEERVRHAWRELTQAEQTDA